jgi:hypothetical protein
MTPDVEIKGGDCVKSSPSSTTIEHLSSHSRDHGISQDRLFLRKFTGSTAFSQYGLYIPCRVDHTTYYRA